MVLVPTPRHFGYIGKEKLDIPTEYLYKKHLSILSVNKHNISTSHL